MDAQTLSERAPSNSASPKPDADPIRRLNAAVERHVRVGEAEQAAYGRRIQANIDDLHATFDDLFNRMGKDDDAIG